ncbi:hypothetical protein O181_066620 [Austropuccinia psidii MF-1]|uniref:Uncharacterized protein n=1 Tax=Austropuccinia psidii MF-1 TaxID=1389203 RepID=A0A9Q3EPB9_9BASI|nr:hypothetical protein [Austropuccinia psidii MF-1]
MSPVHLRNIGFQRNQPEDREGLSRARRPGRGNLGHSGTSNHRTGKIWMKFLSFTNSSKIYFNGAWTTRGSTCIPLARTWCKFPEDLSQRDRLQRPYGNNQRLESYKAVQTPGGEGKQNKGESSHYPRYRRKADSYREYSDSFKLTRSRPNLLSSGFTPFRNQQISGQESPFFTIPGGFQEKTRIQGQKQDHLEPEEERVRPKDPEAVGFGERSSQEQK